MGVDLDDAAAVACGASRLELALGAIRCREPHLAPFVAVRRRDGCGVSLRAGDRRCFEVDVEVGFGELVAAGRDRLGGGDEVDASVGHRSAGGPGSVVGVGDHLGDRDRVGVDEVTDHSGVVDGRERRGR